MSSNSSGPAKHEARSPRSTLHQLFLTLFLRGRSARGLQKESAPKSIGQKLALTLLWYALFGLMALMLFGQRAFLLSIYLHAMTLVFLGMFVASSAGELLFNREEADILMHRPILPRDLLWAKIRVLTQVSTWLAMAFNLPGLVVGALAPDGGWLYAPVHTASTALMALFCTASVVLVYQLCLRWFGRERLDGLMTTAQVVFVVAAVLSSQMLPEIFGFFRQGEVSLSGMWWIMLLPPAWFAGIDDAVAGSGAPQSWLLAAVGGLATVIVLWLAFQKLAQGYEEGLQILNEGPRKHIHHTRGRWLDKLLDRPPLSWWLADPRERAAFLLATAYLVRDRDVKLRVYPAIVPFLIFPVVFMLREVGTSDAGEGFGFVVSSSYIGVVPLMVISLLQFSQHWQAADVFRVVPLEGPGPLCHGVRKAVLLLLTLPLVVALAACVWLIARDLSSLVLLLPGILVLPLVALLPSLRGRCIPLSQPGEQARSASRGITILGTIMATMVLSGIAMLAWHTGWLWLFLVVEAVLVAILYLVLRRDLDRAGWPAME